MKYSLIFDKYNPNISHGLEKMKAEFSSWQDFGSFVIDGGKLGTFSRNPSKQDPIDINGFVVEVVEE